MFRILFCVMFVLSAQASIVMMDVSTNGVYLSAGYHPFPANTNTTTSTGIDFEVSTSGLFSSSFSYGLEEEPASAPPDIALIEPTNSYPVSFADFAPTVGDTSINPLTPAIAEWTRTADTSDAMALTAEKTPSDIVFYGEGESLTNGSIELSSGQHRVVTLPSSLPTNEFYLAWPQNAYGYGSPVRVNCSEAWWITPSLVSVGETFSVYGRNLDLGDGICQAYIEGHGWVTNSSVNPYKADFVVPELANGTHTIYAHNGKGREYGWADGLEITIQNARDWGSGSNYNVTAAPYNADETGATDSLSAIMGAISDASAGDTIYFPTGTYAVSGTIDLNDKGGLRFMGDGMDESDIRPIEGFYNVDGRFFQDFGHGTDFIDITFNGNEYGIPLSDDLIKSKGTEDIRFTRVRFSQELMTTDVQGDNAFVNLGITDHLRMVDCEFNMGGTLQLSNTDDVMISNCSFRAMFDQIKPIQLDKTTRSVFLNNSLEHYDDSDPTDSKGFGSGRFINGNSMSGVYVGGCTTVDITPRFDPAIGWYENPNQNAGEWFMTEGGSTEWVGYPVSSSLSNTTFSGIDGDVIVRSRITITEGTGFGQSRHILALNEDVVTVDNPWVIKPDQTSRITFDECASRVIIYGNNLDGMPRNNVVDLGSSSRNIAISAFQPYNGSDNWIVASNTVHEYRHGARFYSRYHASIAGDTDFHGCPSYFNMVVGNTFNSCMDSIAFIADHNTDASQTFVPITSRMGNVVANNTITNCTGQAAEVYIEDGPTETVILLDTIFENNIGYGASTNLTDWDATLWITNGNTWNGGAW